MFSVQKSTQIHNLCKSIAIFPLMGASYPMLPYDLVPFRVLKLKIGETELYIDYSDYPASSGSQKLMLLVVNNNV